MSRAFSEEIISILVFSGVMTMWVLIFQQMYEAWVSEAGGYMGIGEVFMGFTIPAVIASVVTWILIKRIRANRP